MSEPFKAPFSTRDESIGTIDGAPVIRRHLFDSLNRQLHVPGWDREAVTWLCAKLNATPTAPAEDEREAFERWASATHHETVSKFRLIDGRYNSMTLNLEWAAWQARASRAPVPAAAAEGWRLVPVEPTEDMRISGAAALDSEDYPNDAGYAASCYRTMLAAAPQPPAAAECTIGVGDGSGKLFVHGSYDAIKRVQVLLEQPGYAEAIGSFAQWFVDTYHMGYEYDSPNQEHHRVKHAFMAGRASVEVAGLSAEDRQLVEQCRKYLLPRDKRMPAINGLVAIIDRLTGDKP